jgi:FlaG/FlaF family flagellin (archaellin)
MGVEAAALMIGLPLFLWGCEKEVSERGSGEKVTINFTVSNGDYDADQQVIRSAGAKGAEPEAVYMPLNDDYFLIATLEPEPAGETTFDGSQLRAVAEFAPSQKIYFAVYSGVGTSPLDEAIYEWDGSKFVPDGEPLGVEPNGTDYHFVAYSFFGDPTEEPYVEDIEPFQDFVWGEKDQQVYDTELSRTVPILMKHKFSRVSVKVDASSFDNAQVTGVSGVVIAGGKKVTIAPKTGAVDSYGEAVTETLGGWTSEDGGKARLSGYKVFCPSLTTITFATLDITMDGTPLAQLTNQSVTFAQTLLENTSYRVVVDVRTRLFAWSNIYWDSSLNEGAGGMTFDTTDEGHEGYQGLLFKFGSLVGVSPALQGGQGLFSSSVPVYSLNSVLPGYTNWDDIQDGYDDICEQINAAYRLPRNGEFGTGVVAFGQQGWVKGGYFSYTGSHDDVEGKYDIIGAGYGYARNTMMGNVVFPASGMRWRDPVHPSQHGMVMYTGYEGDYWSSTMSGSSAYFLAFGNGTEVDPNYVWPRGNGFPIRCIKDN